MKLDLGIMAETVQGVLAGSRYAKQQPSGSLYFSRRFPHVPRNIPYEQDQCPCAAWGTADAAWIAMTPEERAAWNDAVAIPGISGYDLYMSWAVQCFNLGLNAPGTPPLSGGYSFNPDYCVAGAAPPPECVKEPPPPVGVDCAWCATLTPAYVDVIGTGFTDQFAWANGTHKTDQDPREPCKWQWRHDEEDQEITCHTEENWEVSIGLEWEREWINYRTTVPSDCYEETVLPYSSDSDPIPHPDTILWIPGAAP